MDNFELKKYLIENKVTLNSRLQEFDSEGWDEVHKVYDNIITLKVGDEITRDMVKHPKDWEYDENGQFQEVFPGKILNISNDKVEVETPIDIFNISKIGLVSQLKNLYKIL